MENPLIPMGAITGRPGREQIAGRLQAFYDAGITQYLIYPRSGCEFEYMSDEWLDFCVMLVEEAQRIGFTSIWLYDEFNWPSGTCAKRVPQENPDYALHQLSLCYEKEAYHFEIRRNMNMSNLCNPDAVDCFIRMTHEKYAERLGKYMGSLIKGFFTDEPEIGYFLPKTENEILSIPYYEGVEEDYERETGSKLRSDILRSLENGDNSYVDVSNRIFAKRFRKTFAERISDWCAKRGMVLTGHLMEELNPGNALRCSGHPLEILSAFTLPGIDDVAMRRTMDKVEWLTLGTGMYAIEKQGNKDGLAELFAIGPCDMTFSDIRRQIRLFSAFGIGKFLLAISPLDMRGNLDKPYYLNPFSETQPWFEFLKQLAEDATDAAIFARKKRVFDVYLRYDYHSVPVDKLARDLAKRQYSYCLVLPDDAPRDGYVLSFRDDKIFEERSGKFFQNVEDLEKELLNAPKEFVADETGKRCRDIFLRRNEDGSALIIDFSGETRNLFFRGVNFNLYAGGVIEFPAWEVLIDSPNTLRADFENGMFEFETIDDFDELRIAIRNYKDIPKLSFDDLEIKNTVTPAKSLPQGFAELYTEYIIVKPAKGKHHLKLLNSPRDRAYFPLAVITGNFSRENNSLRRYLDDGAGLRGYAGKIRQRTRLRIPHSALKIAISDTNKLPSELFIDGISQGRRLWPPFEWVIPYGMQGEFHEVEILRASSCGQIFGEKSFEDTDSGWDNWLKKNAPDNSAPLPGTVEITWIN